MRVRAAWRLWLTDQDSEAGAALARRYEYLPAVDEALMEFNGRPGDFAAFARRRSLTPPSDPGPVLATAILDRSLEPTHPVLPRRSRPAAPAAPQSALTDAEPLQNVAQAIMGERLPLGSPVIHQQTAPAPVLKLEESGLEAEDDSEPLGPVDPVQQPALAARCEDVLEAAREAAKERQAEGQREGGLTGGRGRPKGSIASSSADEEAIDRNYADTLVAKDFGIGESSLTRAKRILREAPDLPGDEVAAIPAPLHRAPATIIPSTPARAAAVSEPGQVAEVRVLPYWRASLSVVHRITRPDDDREIGTLRLAVERGCVRLFGRDPSRAHWATVPAHTEGTAAVALAREDVLLRQWGQPGKLSIFGAWLRFESETGGIYWAPVEPGPMPLPPDEPGVAGVVLHRHDLEAALRENLGGWRSFAEMPEEVRLLRAGAGLQVTSTCGEVTLPAGYVHGQLDVRVRPRLLLEAVSCCPSVEVTLESLGEGEPLRIESGWYTGLLCTRSEASYL